MTNYEYGFMSKCAEYGIGDTDAISLYKLAQQYNRSEFDNAIQDQMNSIADEEGLDIDSTNKPGTMLGRGFRRMFMSKDSYGRYQANLASEEIAKARQRKQEAAKAADRKAQDRMRSQQIVNGIGRTGAPRTPQPAQPAQPARPAQPAQPARPAQPTRPAQSSTQSAKSSDLPDYLKPLGPTEELIGPASYRNGQWYQDTRPGWTENKETGVWHRHLGVFDDNGRPTVQPTQLRAPTQPSVYDYMQGIHPVPKFTEDGSTYGIKGHPYYNYIKNINKYMGFN